MPLNPIARTRPLPRRAAVAVLALLAAPLLAGPFTAPARAADKADEKPAQATPKPSGAIAGGIAGNRMDQKPAKPAPKEVVKEPSSAVAPAPAADAPASPLDFTLQDIDGKDQKLSDYKGKVVLLVNVASKCGNTPQYKNLEALFEKYKGKGLVVVGIPANNFGGQEPASNQQIKEFCTGNFHVTFPMMAKVSVKGEDKAPLYRFLTEPATAGEFAGDVEWNFGKFLIDRNGNLMARFAPRTKPDEPKVVAAVEKALAAPAAEKK